MKSDLSHIERYKRDSGDDGARYEIPIPHQFTSKAGRYYTVIASWGEGWDHVSVSTPTRCLSWMEMEYIRRVFFEDHETVMQIHPPVSDYVNVHPYCLHLWRPQNQSIPTPPLEFV